MTRVPEFPGSALACDLTPASLMEVLPPGEMASDYQWLSLKTWNPAAQISVLDGAMVVRFSDYHDDGIRFFGFTGGDDAAAIAAALLEEGQRRGYAEELRLVPASVVQHLPPCFDLSPDRDNFDYVYETRVVNTLDAPGHRLNRKQRNKFRRHHEGCHRTVTMPANLAPWDELIEITERWASGARDPEAAVDEIKALIRCVTTLELHPVGHEVLVTTLEIDQQIRGFDITEISQQGWALNHFRHTPRDVVGAHTELRACVAGYLLERGVGLWNAEQDLGVEGLRARKVRDRPVRLVEKYSVRSAHPGHRP